MATKISELRKGQGVKYNNEIWTIWSTEHVVKGKGGSYYQIELRNARTGQIIGQRFRPDDQLEPVHFDRKKMEYLFSSGDMHTVMDKETYEQIEIPGELIGDQAVYLKENIDLDVAFVEGQIIEVELPNTVELTVVDTPPQVKGATATNQLKDATCEGGARIKVPPFVENGTVVKVDTRSGEYISRA